MDVLPIPTLADLNLIIPGALRQPHVSFTFSMTPDEFAIVQVSAAAPHIAERDAANLIRDRAVMERTEALEQLAAANEQIQKLNATNIDNAALITALQQQLADGTSDRLRIVLTENDTLAKTNAAQNDTIKAASATIARQLRVNEQQSDMLKDAQLRLAKYEPGTPPLPTVIPGDVVPPVIVPGDIAPTITKTQLNNLAGITITTDNAPSTRKDNQTRDLLALCGDMGFNTVRWYPNPREIQDQVALLKQASPLCLTTFARAHGMTPILDTADNVALNLSNNELKDYFDAVKLLGFVACFFNDANQYRDAKNEDGTPKYPPGTLERLVKRIRDVAPDLPLFASVTASAKVADYKPLFDWLEFQSFGKISVFDDYLKLPCDLLCLDAQRSATPEYLEKMTALFLEAHKDAFFVYTAKDDDTLFLNMPETVAIYRVFLTKWKAQRMAIVAQPA